MSRLLPVSSKDHGICVFERSHPPLAFRHLHKMAATLGGLQGGERGMGDPRSERVKAGEDGSIGRKRRLD